MVDKKFLLDKALDAIASDQLWQLVEYVKNHDNSLEVIAKFRKSIAYACELQREKAIDESINRLDEIVDSLETLENNYASGDITENIFIDEALWLCLEGVVLVMTNGIGLNWMEAENYEKLNAVAGLVFEYFKYKVYHNMLHSITKCVEYQEKLDKKLAEELNTYIDNLHNELDQFDLLVNIAFSDDIEASFEASGKIAELEGVNREEILRSIEDVDSIFSADL